MIGHHHQPAERQTREAAHQHAHGQDAAGPDQGHLVAVQHESRVETQERRPGRGGSHEAEAGDPQVPVAQRALENVHVLSAHPAPIFRSLPLASHDHPYHGEDAEQGHEGQQSGAPVVAERGQDEGRSGDTAPDHQPEHGVGDAVEEHHLAGREPLLGQERAGRLAGDDGDAEGHAAQDQHRETRRQSLGQQEQRAQYHGDGGEDLGREPRCPPADRDGEGQVAPVGGGPEHALLEG